MCKWKLTGEFLKPLWRKLCDITRYLLWWKISAPSKMLVHLHISETADSIKLEAIRTKIQKHCVQNWPRMDRRSKEMIVKVKSRKLWSVWRKSEKVIREDLLGNPNVTSMWSSTHSEQLSRHMHNYYATIYASLSCCAVFEVSFESCWTVSKGLADFGWSQTSCSSKILLLICSSEICTFTKPEVLPAYLHHGAALTWRLLCLCLCVADQRSIGRGCDGPFLVCCYWPAFGSEVLLGLASISSKVHGTAISMV